MIQGKNGSILAVNGFMDLHVHLREPGHSEKETILTGTASAIAGGYSLICPMPNLCPAPDSLENLGKQLSLINTVKTRVCVLPFGTITMNRNGKEPVAYASLLDEVAGFSDDGSGVEDDQLMHTCMREIAACGGLLSAHCELMYNHQTGEKVESIGEREWREVERNIRFAKETGCRLHICHVSTKESVELIREGKRMGVRVTAETAPHYLVFNEEDIRAYKADPIRGGAFKMNPPIGSKADQEALLKGIQDGTIDVIATDHAPHTAEEKSRGFAGSLSGIVGMESAFPVLYTKLVKEEVIPMERLMEMMSDAPARILMETPSKEIRKRVERAYRETTFINLIETYTMDSANFKSKGRSCPFDGMEVYGRILQSI